MITFVKRVSIKIGKENTINENDRGCCDHTKIDKFFLVKLHNGN